jgi:hypothetical protein
MSCKKDFVCEVAPAQTKNLSVASNQAEKLVYSVPKFSFMKLRPLKTNMACSAFPKTKATEKPSRTK